MYHKILPHIYGSIFLLNKGLTTVLTAGQPRQSLTAPLRTGKAVFSPSPHPYICFSCKSARTFKIYTDGPLLASGQLPTLQKPLLLCSHYSTSDKATTIFHVHLITEIFITLSNFKLCFAFYLIPRLAPKKPLRLERFQPLSPQKLQLSKLLHKITIKSLLTLYIFNPLTL